MTPERAKEEVQKLGLPAVFTQVWEGKIPDVLDHDWRKPYVYFEFREEIEESCPRLKRCVPLWECNGDHIYAYDPSNGEYVLYYYEDLDSMEVLADNYQGFAAAYLVDSVFAGDENLDEIASILEFKYLDRVKKWAEIESTLDVSEEKRRFVASIPPGR